MSGAKYYLVLSAYVFGLVIFGWAQKVLFKIVQASMINYLMVGYLLIALLKMLIYFFLINIQLLWTDAITPKMMSFRKWKFGLIGFFIGLANFLYFIAGAPVPGFSQVLLWQGEPKPKFSDSLALVPVTMIFSLLLLRYEGNSVCRTARAILDKNQIKYTEIYLGDEVIAKAQGEPLCKLFVNGRSIGDIPSRLRLAKPPDHDIVSRTISTIFRCICPTKKDRHSRHALGQLGDVHASSGLITVEGNPAALDSSLASLTLLRDIDKSELLGEVLLFTDGYSWKRHLGSFYSGSQYLGGSLIILGFSLCAFSEFTPTDGEPIWVWFFLFLLGSIPAGLGAVYQEIALQSVGEMDIWYLSAWSSLAEFVFGLAYLPLTAKITGIGIPEGIIGNILEGLNCLAGVNSKISERGYTCQNFDYCFDGDFPTHCCDSCDGVGFASYFLIPAGISILLYVLVDVFLATFIGLVTKSSTSPSTSFVCLSLSVPLAAVSFVFPFLWRDDRPSNSNEVDIYTITGLCVVLLGLFVYGFVDMFCRYRNKEKLLAGEHPYFGTAYSYESFSERSEQHSTIN